MNQAVKCKVVACVFLVTLSLVLPTGAVAREKQPLLDQFGDPLPTGAIARVGSLRFRHAGPVSSLHFTPDGKALMSIGFTDRSIRLWDVGDGREKSSVSRRDEVLGIAISPDGTRVLFAGIDAVLILDAATGKELHKYPPPLRLHWPHSMRIKTIFSHDGKQIFAADWSELCLWDADSGKVSFRVRRRERLWPATISPDGKYVALYGKDGDTIEVWSVKEKKAIRQIKTIHVDGFHALAYSPDGKTLATGGFDGIVGLWDVSTGEKLKEMVGHQSPVMNVHFSPDGKLLASGGISGLTVRLWNPKTGRQIHECRLHCGRSVSLAFSLDSKLLATGSTEGAIRLWDTVSGKQCPQSQRVPELDTGKIAFSPSGSMLASVGGEKRLQFWDAANGKKLRESGKHPLWITCFAFSPDGSTLASDDRHKWIHLWDAKTGEKIRQMSYPKPITGMAFSPDGKVLAIGDRDEFVRLIDIVAMKECSRMSRSGRVESIIFSPNGTFLMASGGITGTQIWNAKSGNEYLRFPQQHGRTFSSDGKVIVSHDVSNTISLLEVSTGKKRQEFADIPFAITCCASLTGNGRQLVMSLEDGQLQTWDVATGKAGQKFPAHRGKIVSLVSSSDGRLLASGSIDGTVLIWDTAKLFEQRELQEPIDPDERAIEIAWRNLRHEDGTKAGKALWDLVMYRNAAVALLRRELKPVAPVDQQRIKSLFEDLDSDVFRTRENATKELEKLGELIEPALQRLLAEEPPPEVRKRAEDLMAKLEKPLTDPEKIRAVRAIEVLEHISTTEARNLLQKLATGAPEALLTQEAKWALSRISKRPKPTK